MVVRHEAKDLPIEDRLWAGPGWRRQSDRDRWYRGASVRPPLLRPVRGYFPYCRSALGIRRAECQICGRTHVASLLVSETTEFSYSLDIFVALLEVSTHRLNSQGFYESCWGALVPTCEIARECPWAHADETSKALNTEIGVEVAYHPGRQVRQLSDRCRTQSRLCGQNA